MASSATSRILLALGLALLCTAGLAAAQNVASVVTDSGPLWQGFGCG
jgi:chitinase